MLRPCGPLASVLVLLMVLGLLTMVPAQVMETNEASETDEALETDEETDEEAEVTVAPQVVVTYTGGAAEGKRAQTQTAQTSIGESNGWVFLPNAGLTWFVPANDSDLLNVAFSAECQLVGSVPPDDWVRIRILVNGVPMDPYDGQQAFCSAPGKATHKGNWVKRVGPGNYTLRVQFWIFDGGAAGALTAIIDDWTFELVVYN